jgi:hypothetical protein
LAAFEPEFELSFGYFRSIHHEADETLAAVRRQAFLDFPDGLVEKRNARHNNQAARRHAGRHTQKPFKETQG